MNHSSSEVDLRAIAEQVVRARGFNPQFPPPVQQQVGQIQSHPPAITPNGSIRDLRSLLWSSIDNDDSKDLDQIEVAERIGEGQIKVLVGIADVDTFAGKDSPIDAHAAREATTVYTGVRVFPMLPEQLSTGLTSLLEGADKLAVVTEFVIDGDGQIQSSNVYRAIVRNKAQLTYSAVGAWLEGKGNSSSKVGASPELQAQIKLQSEAAEKLKKQRFLHGALTIESTELQPIMSGDQIVGVAEREKNRASELIEELMIAANESIARMLEAKKVASIRRVVKTPERWDRIVQLASQHGGNLPTQPDPKALNDFLIKRKTEDPDHFADVSLTVVKLMGPGEYELERPGDAKTGHFGLAVQDYTHSTAPNRRFPDMVTQRLIKSVLAGTPSPYSDDTLNAIAKNCTERQDAARKVQRDMQKRIAAVALKNSIGQIFDAIVTGNNEHGTFVRIMKPHVEGMLVGGHDGVDVGDRLRVKLVNTDVRRGYIDFVRE
ncbi:MAG TPA: RNB domain-containing ribonuclease [Terriglobales bacterium]|nr:RNB domain-containing ribonuclease [Terriglobales bacterium]